MINGLVGKKIEQTQRFLTDGTRIPVTEVDVTGNAIVMVKTNEKDGYSAIQLASGIKKNPTKALLGHIKGANLKNAPFLLKEVRIEVSQDSELPKVGDSVKATEVLKAGDIVDVTGISKGKGFAGVVKRHHFKGGPRTHGQSDRERAPGSIGQTTTPGRVYKGKRMAGRMGHETVTIKNLKVVDVTDTQLWLEGLAPGVRNSYIVIKKVGEMKKFTPLFKEELQKPQESLQKSPEVQEETKSEPELKEAEKEVKEGEK